jgi:hypothetical protein
VPAPRRPIELTLERTMPDPNGGPPVVLRVSARWEPPDGGAEAGRLLADEIRSLRAELDAAITAVAPGSATMTRPDRTLEELIGTYRPRQPELLDLLKDEGELSGREYELLRSHLTGPATGRPAPAGVPITERPIAAAPLETDHAPSIPRPVEELLRTFQIASLKQAGAVRARRQISFEEYMALKRHFANAPPA